MYLSRSSPLMFLVIFALAALWLIGGWLLGRSVFRLKSRERAAVGLGLGFLLHLVLSNLISHILSFQWAYPLGCGAVLLLGIVVSNKRLHKHQVVVELRSALIILPAFLILFALFSMINRGLAIFDEGYNLPLVSRMAAGDVPPHFFLYPDYPMPYHYGLHLFAAALTRFGGLYPWSAFDFARAFTHALMLVLATLWFWRMTQSWFGGLIGSTVTYFAGGSQWLLLFAPPAWLMKVSAQIPLINSAAVSGADFYDVLTRPWAIEGGSAPPFAFAYISGIFLPQNLALTSNGACLALTIFLLLLIAPRHWTLQAAFIASLILASLALTGEHLFALIIAAMALVWLAKGWFKGQGVRYREAGLLLGLATICAILFGGVIAVWFTRRLTSWFRGETAYGYGLTGFRLHLPPAMMSVHFGRLELFDLNHLMVALAQMGPAVALLIVSAFQLWQRWKRWDWQTAALFVCPWLGIAISLVVDYQDRSREITRFLDVALLLGVILALPFLFRLYSRFQPVWQIALLLLFFLMIFSGLATFSVQLVSIPKPQFTYFISPLDAHFTRSFWDVLPTDTQIFDPNPSRSIVIFGRSAGRVSYDYRKPLPEWLDLVENFNLGRLLEEGYTHFYLDERYWSRMNSQEKSALERPCIRLVASQEGTGQTFRRLYNLSGCR